MTEYSRSVVFPNDHPTTRPYLTFDLDVTASHLFAPTYNDYQQFLYDTITDLREKGWFFVSTSYDKIDARFLFGGEKNVSADELIMKVKPETSSNEQFSVEDIRVGDQNDEGQYAILAIIIVAAIGAALFYLKGYKRSH